MAAEHPNTARLDVCATFSLQLGKNFSATDLTAQVGYPNHAPQLVEFTNYGSAEANAIYTPLGGTEETKILLPGATWAPKCAVSAVSASSSADVAASVSWWPTRGFALNVA